MRRIDEKARFEPSDPEPEPEPEGTEDGEESTPSQDGRALVALCETVLLIAVRVQASKAGIDPSDERVIRMQRLTQDERFILLELAPLAAPFLQKILERAPVVGVCAFGLVYTFFLSARFALLDDIKRERDAVPADAVPD